MKAVNQEMQKKNLLQNSLQLNLKNPSLTLFII